MVANIPMHCAGTNAEAQGTVKWGGHGSCKAKQFQAKGAHTSISQLGH